MSEQYQKFAMDVPDAFELAGVAALAGVKGKHDSDRTVVRHGREHGPVTLGGRRVPGAGCRSSGRGSARPMTRGS